MKTPINIAIVGTYHESAYYPNVKYLIESIKNDTRYNLLFARSYIKSDTFFNQQYFSFKRYFCLFQYLIASLKSVYRINNLRSTDCHVVHIPYPAVFVLFIASILLKRELSFKVSCDFFISIYDTVVKDRKLLSKKSFLARILFFIEKRALTYADIILVDTPANKDYLCSLYNISKENVIYSPLFTDETNMVESRFSQGKKVVVLFFSSFVPLHGVETVFSAIEGLASRDNLEFSIVGSGQTSDTVEEIAARLNKKNFTWNRQWLPPEQLADQLNRADICLGIFGDTEKAERVWPLKNYIAMGSSKPIISRRNSSGLFEGVTEDVYYPVAPNDSDALAEAISNLAKNENQRYEMGTAAGNFYRKHLSNNVALENLYKIFTSN